MDPLLGTFLNNALDDAALLYEVLSAWLYSRGRFGAFIRNEEVRSAPAGTRGAPRPRRPRVRRGSASRPPV